MKCLGVIDKIIKNAVKIGNDEVSQDEVGHTTYVEVYYCPVEIDSEQYSARLTVKQYENRGIVLDDIHLYDLASKPQKPDAVSRGTGTKALTPTSASGLGFKVKDLIHTTKTNDQKLHGITDSSKLLFSRITKERDKEYLDAVRAGDMAKAQEMVLKAARNAGYDTHAYHGTMNGRFFVFDNTKGESQSAIKYDNLYAFSSSPNTADTYRMGRSDDPKTEERYGDSLAPIETRMTFDSAKVTKKDKQLRYGELVKKYPKTEYGVVDPNGQWYYFNTMEEAEKKPATKVTVATGASHSTSKTIVLSEADIAKIRKDAEDAIEKDARKKILYSRITPEQDKEYLAAVESGDMEKAQQLVNEAARSAGYDANTDYQGSIAFNGAAPTRNGYFETREERKAAFEDGSFEDTYSLGDYMEAGIDNNDLEWQLANSVAASAQDEAKLESVRNLSKAVKDKKRTIKMYRAVPADVQENSFRNGDWVTPSRQYAQHHIERQDWEGGRIIEQEVSVDNIWWDGNDINEWGYDDGNDYAYKNTPNNRKLLDPVTYDDSGNVIPLSERFNESDPDIRFSKRTKPAPTKTGIGYKVFFRGKDGKLYPPMVANPDGADTPIGVWLDADAAPVAGTSKTGRLRVKAGGKGTQGGSGSLSYRPGWHLGEIPYALQFNRVNPETGEKELFPRDFVWAEVEYAADVDYQKDAEAEGINKNGKFQHSLAGLKRVPEDGFYRYRTNPNPKTDPWIITGAMKVNPVLTDEEVDDLVRKAGREPQKREPQVRFSKGKKKASETAYVPSDDGHQPTVVSDAAGTKIVKNLGSLADSFENLTNPTNTFIGDVAKALGARRYGSGRGPFLQMSFRRRRGSFISSK